MIARERPDALEPESAELAPNAAELPTEPPRKDRRGSMDRRPDTHPLPRGPFRPMPDPGTETTVKEAGDDRDRAER